MANNALILQICRFALAFLWIYQGLVPKLLGPHADELTMNMSLGLTYESAVTLSYIAGTIEIIIGVLILAFYRQKWPFMLTIVAMLGLTAFTFIFAPQFVTSAFNSVSANVVIAALAAIALISQQDKISSQNQ